MTVENETPLNAEERRAKLNLETAKIPWHNLQRYFASGWAVGVSPAVSLLDVACAMADDDKSLVEGWMTAGQVSRVSDAQAAEWYEANALMWAVVVNPWVVVQPVMAEPQES